MAGCSDTLLASVPFCDVLRSTVPGRHVGELLEPAHVFRTKAFSNPLVMFAARFVESDENATYCASPAPEDVELMVGSSLKALPGVTLSSAMETSDVAAVHPEVNVPQVSLTKICWTPD